MKRRKTEKELNAYCLPNGDAMKTDPNAQILKETDLLFCITDRELDEMIRREQDELPDSMKRKSIKNKSLTRARNTQKCLV